MPDNPIARLLEDQVHNIIRQALKKNIGQYRLTKEGIEKGLLEEDALLVQGPAKATDKYGTGAITSSDLADSAVTTDRLCIAATDNHPVFITDKGPVTVTLERSAPGKMFRIKMASEGDLTIEPPAGTGGLFKGRQQGTIEGEDKLVLGPYGSVTLIYVGYPDRKDLTEEDDGYGDWRVA